ncbi:Protein M3 [Allomyces javanicus]|nr:Protein M3 [Allomyces javanicus]
MAVDIGLALGAAARALIKVALSCGAGAVAFRLGLFTVPAMKQMSTLYIKIFLPCLLFANTAVAISPSNAASAGPLIGFCVLYLVAGHLVGYILFRFLRAKLPRHFQRTLLPVAGIGNHGDLVLSILLTVGNNPPFRQGDAALGIAFVTLFLVPLNVTLFAFGSAAFQADMKHLINNDEEVLNGEEVLNDEEVPQVVIEPPKSDEFDGGELETLNGRGRSKKRLSIESPATASRRYSPSLGPAEPICPDPDDQFGIPLDALEPPQLDRKPSISVSVSGVSFASQRAASPAPLSTRSARPPAWRRIASRIWANPIVQTLTMPPNFALVLGLLVALIPGVKSVLVPVAGSTSVPPLAVIYDTTTFLGNGAMPLSMCLFGAALTTIDPDWRAAAVGVRWAAVWLVFYRLLFLPVAGIALVEGMVAWGWIDAEAKMLRFVLMMQACVPTAQMCLILTQYFHPRGESKEVATVMALQYAISVVTLTASLTYILAILS